jgi:hypothetical protein
MSCGSFGAVVSNTSLALHVDYGTASSLCSPQLGQGIVAEGLAILVAADLQSHMLPWMDGWMDAVLGLL